MKIITYSILVSLHLIISTGNNCMAQQKYWIFFDSKDSTSSPAISNETLKNRELLGLPMFQETDLPVNPFYISSLKNSFDIEKIHSSKWLNAISANLNTKQILDLKTLPFIKLIKSINTDLQVSSIGNICTDFENQNSIKITYPLVQIGYKEIIENGLTGNDVKIGVVDAGFYRADQDSGLLNLIGKNKIIATKDFVNPLRNDRFFDFETKSDFHGTEVLKAIGGYNYADQLIYGFAIKSSYYLARTDSGKKEFRGEEDNWIAAVEWLDSLGVRLVNTSLGYTQGFTNPSENYNIEDLDGNTSIISKGATIAAKEKGMILVVSAGNEGENNKWQQLISTPADSEFTIAVGANDESGLKMSYSSIGPSGLKYTKPNLSCFSKFGTSLAAPVITGLIAIMLEKEGSLSLNEINQRLYKSSLLYPFENNYVGYGYPESKYLINNENDKKIVGLKKRKKVTLNTKPEQKILIFNKLDHKIVLNQYMLTAKESKTIFQKPIKAKYTTIKTENQIIEIKWK